MDLQVQVDPVHPVHLSHPENLVDQVDQVVQVGLYHQQVQYVLVGIGMVLMDIL